MLPLGLFYSPPASKRAGDVRHAPFTGSDRELVAVGKRGTHAHHDKLGAHGMSIPHTCMVFHNACIRSVFCFGAQVWSTPYLTSCFSAAMKHPMVVEQRAFMQRLAGAHKPASQLLYAEFALLPFRTPLGHPCSSLLEQHDLWRRALWLYVPRSLPVRCAHSGPDPPAWLGVLGA